MAGVAVSIATTVGVGTAIEMMRVQRQVDESSQRLAANSHAGLLGQAPESAIVALLRPDVVELDDLHQVADHAARFVTARSLEVAEGLVVLQMTAQPNLRGYPIEKRLQGQVLLGQRDLGGTPSDCPRRG